jgi:hypothetical protein
LQHHLHLALVKAGRNTAPFHLGFKHARRELAHLIGLLQIIVLHKSQICHISPAHSSRSSIILIQVHPYENALPAIVPQNHGEPGQAESKTEWPAFLGLDDLS